MPKPPSPDQKSLVGYTIGKCKLLRICGRGAMGTVYKGMHGGLDIEVAVKILPPHLANNSNLVERFLREAKLAARLNHINTVRVYDVGEESGYNYLVMEFIDGTDALELVLPREGQRDVVAVEEAEAVVLVHEVEVALLGERPREEDALLLAAGEIRDLAVGVGQQDVLRLAATGRTGPRTGTDEHPVGPKNAFLSIALHAHVSPPRPPITSA